MILQQASFRGAIFFVTSSDLEGGRKVVLHDFVNSDKRSSEDLGQLPMTFSFDALVRTTAGPQERDALKRALDTKGEGLLVHPFYGSIMVTAMPYTITESQSYLGKATFRLQFAQTTEGLQPSVSAPNTPRVNRPALQTVSAAQEQIAAKVSVVGKASSAYQSTRAKVLSVADTMNNAARVIRQTALAPLQKATSSLGRDINTLLRAPRNLAGAIDDVMSAYQNLATDPLAQLGLNRALFKFGIDDLFPKTVSSIERRRQENNKRVNQYVRASAMSYAMVNATEVDWANTQQLDDFVSEIDAAYDSLADTGDEDVIDSLSETRTQFLQALEIIRPRIYQISEVDTAPIPLDVLSYTYYGSSENGSALADLNDIRDPSLVSGRLRIFTQ